MKHAHCIPLARRGSRRPQPRFRAASGLMPSTAARRRALTLFEVIVSLAIFVGAMAAVSQLIANGARGALQARMQTHAVVRCESKLGELVAGAISATAASNVAYDDDPNWNWSLTLRAGPQESLLIAEVTVAHPSDNPAGNVSYTLSRLLRNPQAAFDALAREEQRRQQQATSSSSSSSSGSGSGSSSSGASGSGSGGATGGSGSTSGGGR
jgi:uncharacterized membrane protein YgcG